MAEVEISWTATSRKARALPDLARRIGASGCSATPADKPPVSSDQPASRGRRAVNGARSWIGSVEAASPTSLSDMASPASDHPDREHRIQFKDYGSWRANLLLWGLPIAVVVILLFASFTSAVSTSVSGIPFPITCDGWSVDPSSGECAAWAQDVVESAGTPQREVTELELKKSWYGFGNQCTAIFTFEGGGTAESEVPCL
jgi:hypothetical protein